MGMGSGKTHAFMKWVSKQIIQNPDFSVLIVSARISFTNSIQEDCERVGVPIASYLDFDNRERFKKIREQQRIIMQLDSLYMVDPKKTFDVVFLDEIQSDGTFSAKVVPVGHQTKIRKPLRICNLLVAADAITIRSPHDQKRSCLPTGKISMKFGHITKWTQKHFLHESRS